MGYSKLGMKAIGVARFGQKAVHGASKFGAKYIAPVATLAGVAAPEVALPMAATAMIAKPLLKTVEKLTR